MKKDEPVKIEKLQIMGMTYTVECLSEIEVDGEKCDGALDFMKQKILIANQFSNDKKITILFHEVLHELLGTIDPKLNENDPFVDTLSRLFFSVLKDNKMLSDFIV